MITALEYMYIDVQILCSWNEWTGIGLVISCIDEISVKHNKLDGHWENFRIAQCEMAWETRVKTM